MVDQGNIMTVDGRPW